MSESGIPSHSSSEKVELSIHIDSELLDQIKHLTNDPSKVIETAIKQWLRGETRRRADMSLHRNPQSRPAASGTTEVPGYETARANLLAVKSLVVKFESPARLSADETAKATGCGLDAAGFTLPQPQTTKR